MKIFRIQVLFDEFKISGKFLLNLIFCNQIRELEDYWLLPFEHSEDENLLIKILLSFLEKWKESIINLKKSEKVFLSIGLWDESVEGFYIKQLENGIIKIIYGSILNWGEYDKTACLYNIKEDIFHKDFEIETTKNLFLQDVQANIKYLEKNIKIMD